MTARQQLREAGPIMSPILQMRKSRHRQRSTERFGGVPGKQHSAPGGLALVAADLHPPGTALEQKCRAQEVRGGREGGRMGLKGPPYADFESGKEPHLATVLSPRCSDRKVRPGRGVAMTASEGLLLVPGTPCIPTGRHRPPDSPAWPHVAPCARWAEGGGGES